MKSFFLHIVLSHTYIHQTWTCNQINWPFHFSIHYIDQCRVNFVIYCLNVDTYSAWMLLFLLPFCCYYYYSTGIEWRWLEFRLFVLQIECRVCAKILTSKSLSFHFLFVIYILRLRRERRNEHTRKKIRWKIIIINETIFGFKFSWGNSILYWNHK